MRQAEGIKPTCSGAKYSKWAKKAQHDKRRNLTNIICQCLDNNNNKKIFVHFVTLIFNFLYHNTNELPDLLNYTFWFHINAMSAHDLRKNYVYFQGGEEEENWLLLFAVLCLSLWPCQLLVQLIFGICLNILLQYYWEAISKLKTSKDKKNERKFLFRIMKTLKCWPSSKMKSISSECKIMILRTSWR